MIDCIAGHEHDVTHVTRKGITEKERGKGQNKRRKEGEGEEGET